MGRGRWGGGVGEERWGGGGEVGRGRRGGKGEVGRGGGGREVGRGRGGGREEGGGGEGRGGREEGGGGEGEERWGGGREEGRDGREEGGGGEGRGEVGRGGGRWGGERWQGGGGRYMGRQSMLKFTNYFLTPGPPGEGRKTVRQLRDIYWGMKDEIFGESQDGLFGFLARGNTQKLEATLKSWLGEDVTLNQEAYPK